MKEIRYYSAYHNEVCDIVDWLKETFNGQGGRWQILDNQWDNKYELVIKPSSEQVATMIRLKWGVKDVN